jgi:hypothetical protein
VRDNDARTKYAPSIRVDANYFRWPSSRLGWYAYLLALAGAAALPPSTAANATRAAPQPTAAACIQAWNRAPKALHTSTARRYLSDTNVQVLAGTASPSGAACGVMFVAGRDSFLLVIGHWAGAAVGSWSTSVGHGSELAKRLVPDDVANVVFRSDGTLRLAPPAPSFPSKEECARDWNRRASAPRLAVARQHPREIHVDGGLVTSVREGVLRVSSQPACRFAFILKDGSALLVFGVWGNQGHVTGWKAPQGKLSLDEASAMSNGLVNASIRADGTLHVFP